MSETEGFIRRLREAQELADRQRVWWDERDKVLASAKQQLAELVDPVARLVLDLHREEDGYCKGCDPGAYAEEPAEWPCSTVVAIGEHYGIKTSEPYPERES